jgi:hypothetical protein
MQEAHSNKHTNNFDGEIDLRELFYVLLKGKWIIISITAFASILGVMYSLSLPNIYESKSVLLPVNSSSNISGALGAYSRLSGLAGINLPTGSDEDNYTKAMVKIESLSFFENSIMPNIFLPDLMAFKAWHSKTNRLDYDKNIYDAESNVWTRDYSYPQKQIPSAQESYEKFKGHLSLSEDSQYGFISLAINHQSPLIAKQWSDLIVNEVNNFYRLKDKLESEKALNYLNQQISLTTLSEIKESLALLIQEQIKKLTLIEANEFYVFDYIDPAVVMEKKSEPKRALICILAAILGGMLSVLFVTIKHYSSYKKV